MSPTKMPRGLIFLLLSTFIYPVASLSLPETTSLHTANTATITHQNTCTTFSLFQLRPLYYDCNLAIDALSSSRVPGTFHSYLGRSMDLWHLPVTQRVGTCKILVRMLARSSVETSTWAALKSAAGRLNEECRVGAPWGDVTGGVTLAGEHKLIEVSIARTAGVVEVAAHD